MIDINYPLTYENAFNGDVSSNNKKIRILIDCLKKLNKFALFKDSDAFALKEPDKISEELTAYFPPQSIKRIK